ncbi:hypothetical protein L596_010164 [Steinernema carpocapsae]|uniref:Uncharacterized protein n=1 Tax=Steinernema carpocapsae TaxID=34508 RepID=A0A4U5PI25_STECR|nr:hypothetical protein L596_010164 [Steinernema carpocapsae]
MLVASRLPLVLVADDRTGQSKQAAGNCSGSTWKAVSRLWTTRYKYNTWKEIIVEERKVLPRSHESWRKLIRSLFLQKVKIGVSEEINKVHRLSVCDSRVRRAPDP